MSSFTERLILAQQAIGTIRRDATNPRFGSRYATLDAIIDQVRPALAAQGLLLTQHADMSCVVTRISDDEHDGITSTVPVCADLHDSQRYGAALTYARRYGIASLLALATDDDDDGNAANPPNEVPYRAPVRLAPTEPTIAAPPRPTLATGTVAADRLANTTIHFGKNKDVRLGDLTRAQLSWYAEKWEPRYDERQGRIDTKDEALQNAAKQLMVALDHPAALSDFGAAMDAVVTTASVHDDESDGIPF